MIEKKKRSVNLKRYELYPNRFRLLERSGVDPGDLPGPAVHFLVHVRRPTRAIASSTVPQTDKVNFTDPV